MHDKHTPNATVNVGIIGYGTVGLGTAQVLVNNRELIRSRAGCDVFLKRIADRDLDHPRPLELPAGTLIADAYGIIGDPDIDIVVEVIGGTTAAREFVLAAIDRGKCVVTSNKELIAKHGAELLDRAKERGVDLYFEGSVGGGIPIVGPMKHGLIGNRVRKIIGIVNGTTNYILTRMARDHDEFDAVLADAQRMGYAEADPSSDVDGLDAVYKICILAAIAHGRRVRPEQVFCEGIRHVAQKDMEYARELGYTIKLLAIAKENGDAVELRVHPALLHRDHPLANVNDVFNAIMVEGDHVGRVMFYGRGAGAEPTGSAVAGDVADCARNISLGIRSRIPCRCTGEMNVRDMGEVENRFCVRMEVLDRPGVLGKIATVFGEHHVSLASVVQRESFGTTAEIVWLTHKVAERQFQSAVSAIRETDVCRQVCSVLRVEDE